MANPLIQSNRQQFRNKMLKDGWVFPMQSVVLALVGAFLLLYMGYQITGSVEECTITSLWGFVLLSYSILIGLACYFAYEIGFHLKEYQWLLVVPIKPGTLFGYIFYRVMVLLLLLGVGFAVLWLPLVYWGAWMLYLYLLLWLFVFLVLSFSLSLLVNLLAGIANQKAILDGIKRLLSGHLPPMYAFSMYASPLSFAGIIIFMYNALIGFWSNELYWFYMLVIGLGVGSFCWLGIYVVYSYKYHVVILYTKDVSLKYQMRFKIGEQEPIFGMWLHHLLPKKVIPFYTKELTQTRRVIPLLFYLPILAPASILLILLGLGYEQIAYFYYLVLVLFGFFVVLSAYRMMVSPLESKQILLSLPIKSTEWLVGKWMVLLLLYTVSWIISLGIPLFFGFFTGWLFLVSIFLLGAVWLGSVLMLRFIRQERG